MGVGSKYSQEESTQRIIEDFHALLLPNPYVEAVLIAGLESALCNTMQVLPH
jgi:hypothetical protein